MSFLVRLWREEEPDAAELATHTWESEVEHVQSGRQWTFDSLPALLKFLRRQAQNPGKPDQPANG